MRFQPLFLSQRDLHGVVDGARGLGIRAARLRRHVRRRRLQLQVTMAAAAIAGAP